MRRPGKQSIFTQQAEYLTEADLQAWTEQHPSESVIIDKLMQAGAKLITGPRGCGKSTLMKKAYYKMKQNRTNKSTALPVYVNYKSSLKLEPLYTNNVNAVYWFNQWLLYKIYDGLYETLSFTFKTKTNLQLTVTPEQVRKLISTLELGNADVASNEHIEVTASDLENDIESILEQSGKNRCVLLLDDAAHAFSPQQQKDFFEFLRLIKSRNVSPKAAIYPGITAYSSAFHIGHDAEEIDVWIKADSPHYIDFMYGLIKKRLPENIFDQICSNKKLIELVFYAAFGIPRALLNMLNLFYHESATDEDSNHITFNRTIARRAIKENYEQTLSVYTSLELKLPIYKTFVTSGAKIYNECLNALKKYNISKGIDRQAVDIAFALPIPTELEKVFGFLQYAGLMLYKDDSRRGEKGTYCIYKIHYAAIIVANAMLGRQSLNVNDYVTAISTRGHNVYPRIQPSALYSAESYAQLFSLALPPCHVCNTQRTNLDAKFCLNCGTRLKTASVFESLVCQKIDKLPLSSNKIALLKAQTSIRLVKDILMDTNAGQIRSARGIGPVWASRIARAAEEFIA